MKSIAEKVALVAQICIALVFVLTTTLYLSGVISLPEPVDQLGVPVAQSNGILTALMAVLALAFAAISAYLLYVNFSEKLNLRRILLFCDSDSATHTNLKVLSNVVRECAKQVDGISVKKIRVRADEKGGFAAIINVRTATDSVATAVSKLRHLLEESFKNTLGLTFNTINFQVDRLQPTTRSPRGAAARALKHDGVSYK